jgi:PAS domain S-box-containing protein
MHSPGLFQTFQDARSRLAAFADATLPWRAMFEQSPVGQALFVPGTTGVIANDAFARLLGTSVESLLGVAPESLVHASDRAEMFRDRAQLEDGELRQVFAERRFVRSDGTLFSGRVATSLVRDRQRRWLFITVEDVTLELQAARGLARTVRKARALIDDAPDDVVAVLHPGGRIGAGS